jgi:hypothetical protein
MVCVAATVLNYVQSQVYSSVLYLVEERYLRVQFLEEQERRLFRNGIYFPDFKVLLQELYHVSFLLSSIPEFSTDSLLL